MTSFVHADAGKIVCLLNFRGLGARAQVLVVILMGLYLLDAAIFLNLIEVELIELTTLT